MNGEEQEAVRQLVEKLDAAVSKQGAKIQLVQQEGENECDVAVNATQEGFLRLGIEIVKAALAPASEAPVAAVPIDIDYLQTDNSEVSLSLVRVDQFPPPPPPTPPPSGCSSPAVFLVCAVIAVGSLMLVGFVTIVRWVFGV